MCQTLRELGIDNQLHYWFVSGDQTSTIEWEIILQQEADEAALVRAVRSAMQIHTHFRSHPVIVNGRVRAAVKKEIAAVPVFPLDNTLRQLGTPSFVFLWSGSGRTTGNGGYSRSTYRSSLCSPFPKAARAPLFRCSKR